MKAARRKEALGLPVLLRLEGRLCVVVGGGRVAERKARALLQAGAAVRVVARALTSALRRWRDQGRIEVRERPYRTGDLAGACLAFAATDDAEVNERVWREARRRKLWINTADDPARCGFYLPSVLRRGALSIAVSTEGRSPALAARIRRDLEGLFGPGYGPLVERLGAMRDPVARRVADPRRRRAIFRRLVEAALPRRGGQA